MPRIVCFMVAFLCTTTTTNVWLPVIGNVCAIRSVGFISHKQKKNKGPHYILYPSGREFDNDFCWWRRRGVGLLRAS